ncbi:MAG TPA: ATP-binding protein [Gemmatimonadales bacterium]|nr:ATP-binding protein [Gemmatimonadales bacterium]
MSTRRESAVSGWTEWVERRWRALSYTGLAAGVAIIITWLGVWLIRQHDGVGLLLTSIATLLTLVTFRHMGELSEAQKTSLRTALARADRRNRELERLRHLAGTLLAGADLDGLVKEVAQSAGELLEAEIGAVTLVVEEGRFLKVKAATGPMEQAVGMLVPMEGSLLGWAVIQDASLVSDNMDADPRSYHHKIIPVSLKTCAIVPLRSAGFVVGTVSVYNRRDGQPFSEHDLQMLQILGDQVVVGLDRASVLAESKRNELALRTKNQELQRATQLKSEFLTNMSHELRTPLNAIIGFSDLLLEGGAGEVTPPQREFVEAVLRNGKHLLSLINSVLDLSKVEAGRMSLSLAVTDIREAIVGAVADTASLRTAKQQECILRLDNDPLTVVADGVRIRQILFNLLSNASKFTPDRGKISLAAVRTRAPLKRPADRAGDRARLLPQAVVWISVTDEGVGIKRQDMPKLFQEFSQVDSSASRRAQGTGLGLALCKKFVDMHGGTIGADSIYGKGAAFWFLLPVDGPVRRSTMDRTA